MPGELLGSSAGPTHDPMTPASTISVPCFFVVLGCREREVATSRKARDQSQRPTSKNARDIVLPQSGTTESHSDPFNGGAAALSFNCWVTLSKCFRAVLAMWH